MVVTDKDIRCPTCGRKLAELATRPWAFQCPKCKAEVTGETEERADGLLQTFTLCVTTVGRSTPGAVFLGRRLTT